MELYFTVIVVGITFLLWSLLIPVQWKFFAAAALSVHQIYTFSVADIYPSLALLAALALWPEFLRQFRTVIHQPPIQILIALMLVHCVSLAWSSDTYRGIRTLVYMLPFIFLFSSAYLIGKTKPQFVYSTLGLVCILMLSQAMLVILFRFSPETESLFLNSSFSGIFIGPNVIEALLDGTAINNVIMPKKTGGFFINANVGAAYLGIGSFVAWLVARQRISTLMLFTALILWLSIFFTGSKAAVILSITLPVAATLLAMHKKIDTVTKRNLVVLAITSLLVTIIFAGSIIDYLKQNYSFIEMVVHTTNVRFNIWKYAVMAFSDNPILGQGFGGWEIGFPNYAKEHNLTTTFPPHNTLIFLWSHSGILAAALGIVFILTTLNFSYRLIRTEIIEIKTIGLALVMVSGWVFVHGMGTNTGLVGEPHQQALFAILLGLAFALRESYPKPIIQNPPTMAF